MAIYHCSIKNISRSSGRTAIGSASYRSGTRLEDKETGIVHDYTKRKDVIYSEIMLCVNAKKEYADREKLWSAVQKIESAKNARLCREIEIAIPKEFDRETQIRVVRDYAKKFVDSGMCADVSIHDKKDGNPHAHILLTTRAIDDKGEWMAKSKKVYDLDKDGNKIFLKKDKTGRKVYKNHKEDITDWNKKEKVEEWRKNWADECNKYLDIENQIDNRSYERQGIEKIPTIHEGYVAREMQKKGKESDRCKINDEIKKDNKKLEKISVEINKLTTEKEKKEKECVNYDISEKIRRFERFRESSRINRPITELCRGTGQRDNNITRTAEEKTRGYTQDDKRGQDTRDREYSLKGSVGRVSKELRKIDETISILAGDNRERDTRRVEELGRKSRELIGKFKEQKRENDRRKQETYRIIKIINREPEESKREVKRNNKSRTRGYDIEL